MRDLWSGDRRFFVVMAVVVLLALAALPLAGMLDDRADRMRPLYQDREHMAVLQYEHTLENGTGVATTVTDGETVEVAGQEFSPATGNTVTVEVGERRYCVQVTGDEGRETDVACWDNGVDPRGTPHFDSL